MTIQCWYLVRSKANSEALAYSSLQEKGYALFYPQLRRQVWRQGRKVEQICALFPQYLFLKLMVGIQDLTTVKSTQGVLGIVRFGEEYAVVPDALIECLQREADPRTGLYHLAEQRLRPRTPVKITDGTFQGMEGVFLRSCGNDRVLVLLDILGHPRPVRISEELVEVHPIPSVRWAH